VRTRGIGAVDLIGTVFDIQFFSEELYRACGNAVDFMWLVEGRTIDHSTFGDFRTKFKRELKDLFRQIGRVAMHLGLISLNQVALDGTRVRANSSRHATASAKTLEERLKILDEHIEKMLAEADHVDQQDKDLFGDHVSPNTLPMELGELKKRRANLKKALEVANRTDAKRAKRKRSSKRAGQEARLLPRSRSPIRHEPVEPR